MILLLALLVAQVGAAGPIKVDPHGLSDSQEGTVCQGSVPGVCGSGATLRTIESKLRDTVSIQDFGGADFGAQLSAATTALPASGGIIDARMLAGDFTVSSGTIVLGTATKPVLLLLGPIRLHNASDPAISVAGASCIIGQSQGGTQNGGTQIIFDGVNNNGINWTGSFGCLKDLELVQGPSGNNGLTLQASGTTGVSHNHFENLRLEGGNSSAGSVGVRLISDNSNALVYANTFVNLRVLEYDRNIQFETTATNGSTTNWFYGTFLGSTTGLGTAAINIISGDTNQFIGGFVQAKAVGIQVGSGAKYNSFSNFRLESNTTNVSNAGTGSEFVALSLDANTVTDTGSNTILNGSGNATYTQKAPSLTVDLGLIVGQGTADSRLQVHRIIQPVQPAPQATTTFPLGNDLYQSVSGPADFHFANLPLDLTATTNAGIGANASIVISTTTSSLCPPSGGCSILIEPSSVANYEIIGSANWSVVDATHISFTAAKAHTQPYTVRQHGGAFFDMGQLARFNLSSPQSYVSVRNSANNTDGFKVSEDSAGNQQLEVNGRMALGTTVSAGVGLFMRAPSGTLTGTSQYGIQLAPITSTAATSQGFGIIARADTVASSFTQTTNACFYAQNPTKGAGSTITNAYGLFVEDITNGGTLNRAIFTSGAALSEFSGGIKVGSNSGTITLAAGTGTATVYSGARCVCTDSTANASVRCAVSSTTLTATGTGTDVIAYLCF